MTQLDDVSNAFLDGKEEGGYEERQRIRSALDRLMAEWTERHRSHGRQGRKGQEKSVRLCVNELYACIKTLGL